MWTNAITVDVCKECGEDIEPGIRILRTVYRDPSGTGGFYHTRVTLCENCGKLWQESQEYGRDD